MSKGDRIYQNFDKFQYTVYSTEYTWKELILTGEYMTTDREIERRFGDSQNGLVEELRSDGWYANILYRFNDWFSLGAYYSKTKSKTLNGGSPAKGDDNGPPPGDRGSDPPPDTGGAAFAPDARSRKYQKDLCITTRFEVNDYITFKLEGHNIKGTNGLSPFDNTKGASGNRWINEWKMFAAKITFSF
jgi:hypothetical protein